MKRQRHLTSAPALQPFNYCGWSFMCCAVPDDRGQFWPVVIGELCWPGGLPVVRSTSQPCTTPELARRCARRTAVAWVKQRTCAAAGDR